MLWTPARSHNTTLVHAIEKTIGPFLILRHIQTTDLQTGSLQFGKRLFIGESSFVIEDCEVNQTGA
jgi:hypothetical protein